MPPRPDPRTSRPPATSVSRQVAGFIAKFDPSRATLIRACRRALRQRFPTAVELVYDNYNFLAMGLGPNERTSECFVSLAAGSRGVSLYFTHGRKLPDPQRVLLGEGSQGGFVRLTVAAQLREPAVEALLRAAVARGKTPLPLSGRGYTVVKSISAKQRPRRAAR